MIDDSIPNSLKMSDISVDMNSQKVKTDRNKMWKQNVETGYTHTNTHTPNERMFIVSTCKNHRTPIIEDIQLPFLFALIVAYL